MKADTWTPETWNDHFLKWAKHHRVALDMNTAQGREMMDVWKAKWAVPRDDGKVGKARVIAYDGLCPSLDELMEATDWMMTCEPETKWVAMYKAITNRIKSQRHRAQVKDSPQALAEEIGEDRAGLKNFNLQDALAAIGRPKEAKCES